MLEDRKKRRIDNPPALVSLSSILKKRMGFMIEAKDKCALKHNKAGRGSYDKKLSVNMALTRFWFPLRVVSTTKLVES